MEINFAYLNDIIYSLLHVRILWNILRKQV